MCGMARKHHDLPLSGGDRKALTKEITKSRAMTTVFAARSAELREQGEALIREADNLACQSWNERLWSDGGPVDPSLGRQRSILCLPLIRQGELVGLLYLENALASHVFTPDRARLLELLGSQTAISLENTRLYGDLREREAKVRRLVDSNIIGICIFETDRRIIETNDAFLSILGYTAAITTAGCDQSKTPVRKARGVVAGATTLRKVGAKAKPRRCEFAARRLGWLQ
jgi:PAS domain-containing protein